MDGTKQRLLDDTGHGQVHKNKFPAQESQVPDEYRQRKIIQTFVLYFGFYSLGYCFGMIGPTLLELQRLMNQSADSISFMLIARAVLGFVGAVSAGFVIDHLNHWLILSLTTGMMCLIYLLIPYTTQLSLMVSLFGGTGAACSMMNVAGNMLLLKVWGDENGPWMQALHFSYGLGTLIGPLITGLFLQHYSDLTTSSSTNPTQMPYYLNITDLEPSGETRFPYNTTESMAFSQSMQGIASDVGTNQSQVHWAYFISAILFLVAVFLFISIIFIYNEVNLNCCNKPKNPEKSSKNEQTEDDYHGDRTFRIQLIILVFFFYFNMSILEDGYGYFLAMYAVQGLGWGEKEGAFVTSVYWATFTAGRGVSILLVNVLSPWVLITGDLILSVTSLGLLLLFVNFHSAVLWGCTILLGLGISNLFATGMTWTKQYIPITGHAGAGFMVSGAVGTIVGPALIGSLFTSFGPKSFLYMMFVEACTLLVTFFLMQWLGESHGKRTKHEPIM